MTWRQEDLDALLAKGQVRVVGATAQAWEPAAISEKAFMQAVIRYAREHSWLCYHTHDSRRSLPGYPDLTLVRGGICLFVECKVPGGGLTLQQAHWLEALGKVQETAAYVWMPEQWNEIRMRLS